MPPRPQFEVADIFRAHGEAYRSSHVLTPDQHKAMWAISHCRTAVLGGHVDVCRECGDKRPAYNSCRNRHCPKCQALAQAEWLEKQKARILPTGYFHVVFTLPSELRPLARFAPAAIYDLLFAAASDTLLTLGRDPKRLGGLLGLTAVLHTWKRDLQSHPHLHCIVTGGALGATPDGAPVWIDAGRHYLFPVAVLSKLFRGKFVAALQRLWARGELELPPDLQRPGVFNSLLAQLRRTRWITYCKRPFAGPEQVFAYLGRYTHRVGLSNKRILAASDEAVTIGTRNGKTATMEPAEFIRRFLLHILPTGYVKIRHYGLVASGNVKTKLEAARAAISGADVHARPVRAKPDWRDALRELTGVDLHRCRACGGTQLERWSLHAPRPESSARGPPELGAPP
jgi:hypothetical protein